MADPQHDHSDDGGVHVHVHSWKLYAGVLGALLLLTAATVATSRVDVDELLSLGNPVEGVGAWNLGIAIVIATIKAGLVVTFFMHLKDDKRFNGLVFLGSLMFVGIFLAYTMNDTYFRGQVGDRYNGVRFDPDTGARAPGGIDVEGGMTSREHGEAATQSHVALAVAAEAEAAAAAEAAPDTPEAAAEEGADDGADDGFDDIVQDILGDEEEGDAAEAADGAETGDFIDDIMDDEPTEDPAAEEPAAEEPAAEEPAAEAPEAPAAAPRPRPRPRPAPAAEEAAAPEAPAAPEGEAAE